MPKLLVPGTGGISFKDNRGNNLGYPVKMQIGAMTGGLIGRSAPDLVALLSMQHTPGQWEPVQTSLEPGTSIEPHQVLMAAYNQLPDFQHFLYDWRADLRYNAKRLCDFLRQTSPNQRWKLVGHSQGGLIISLAATLMEDEEEFSKYVSHVVLVGAPLAGTVKSAIALLEGEQFGPKAAPYVKRFMRTWPALYQMLPAWPMVMTGDNLAPPERQQMEPTGWVGHPGITNDMLLRGRQVQKMLRDPLSHREGNVQVSLLMARNRKTPLATVHKGSTSPSTTINCSGRAPAFQTHTCFGSS